MKMKRIITLIAFTCLLCGSLGGCSKDMSIPGMDLFTSTPTIFEKIESCGKCVDECVSGQEEWEELQSKIRSFKSFKKPETE